MTGRIFRIAPLQIVEHLPINWIYVMLWQSIIDCGVSVQFSTLSSEVVPPSSNDTRAVHVDQPWLFNATIGQYRLSHGASVIGLMGTNARTISKWHSTSVHNCNCIECRGHGPLRFCLRTERGMMSFAYLRPAFGVNRLYKNIKEAELIFSTASLHYPPQMLCKSKPLHTRMAAKSILFPFTLFPPRSGENELGKEKWMKSLASFHRCLRIL